MPKKLGLCLGSGGARGVAHIGVLQALIENDIKIDVISGCSMGSLVGAMYLNGYSPSEMIKLAISLKKSDVFDLCVGMIKNKAVLKTAKVDKLLEQYFGDITIEELKLPFACIATDIISGKPHIFTSGLVRTAIRASCSVPMGFTPVTLGNMLLVDGGISYRTPVNEARELGADVVVAVDVLNKVPKAEKITNIFNLGFRVFDIMSANINSVKKGQMADLVLKPKLKATSPYRVENQQFCYESGYKEALLNIKKIKELIG